MNSLNRTIEKGEVVVLKKKVHNRNYQALEYLLFVVNDGFGTSPHTSGSAIFGHYLSDGEPNRWNGEDIDKAATEKYQAEHGKFEKTVDQPLTMHVLERMTLGELIETCETEQAHIAFADEQQPAPAPRGTEEAE